MKKSTVKKAKRVEPLEKAVVAAKKLARSIKAPIGYQVDADPFAMTSKAASARRATMREVQAVQERLARICINPNTTLVTSHAFHIGAIRDDP